jgi:8-oxo-dGTP pyrophosphatase MutT (NUDIX family)
MAKPDRSTVVERNPLWSDPRASFRVDELIVRHRFGEVEESESVVCFERGDSVAALIVNRDTGTVALVRQHRAPTASSNGGNGSMIELPAGVIKPKETVHECLRRRIAEETGFVVEIDPATGWVRESELIAEFYPSPGACSELVHVLYVPVDSKTSRPTIQASRPDNDFVEAFMMPLNEFIRALDNRTLRDGKTILAGLWLKQRRINCSDEWRMRTHAGHRENFLIIPATNRSIGYFCGDIGKACDIDVWVNSENIHFQMDQFGGRTISARIRTLGALFDDQKKHLVRDTIQDAIYDKLTVGAGVEQGHVIVTPPGELGKAPFNVKFIIHASVIKFDDSEDGVRRPVTTLNVARQCLESALNQFDQLSPPMFRNHCSSMIIPLLGTGQGGVNREQIILDYIDIAIRYFDATPSSKLQQLYLLAYSPLEIEICDRVMSRHSRLMRQA